MFFKLRCHYCGKRSQYSKGKHEFQCNSCQAWNFYDNDGVVVDVSPTLAAEPAPSIAGTYRFNSHPLAADTSRQDDNVFCSRCRKNQQIYTEALSNYLPEEDDPRYAEFEAGLPAAKAELERQYPLVCKKCAAKAQNKIHQADYFGKTQQAAKMMLNTRRNRQTSPVGQRDDLWKFGMRLLLRVAGIAVYASLLAQLAWHTYGIFAQSTDTALANEIETDEFAFEPSLADCVKQTQQLRFNSSCYQIFASLISRALFISFLLLWYNPGLKKWYDGTTRIEAVSGQKEHFQLQVVLLVVRSIAWVILSDFVTTSAWSNQKLLAAHGFMVVFSIMCQWVSERTISVQRWALQGKIMPRAEESDILGATAGPAEESYERQASSVPPHQRLFQRDEQPFHIESLAPRQQARGYSRLDIPSMPPPSPPDSHSDDGDAMDIDNSSYATSSTSAIRSNLRSTFNLSSTPPLGWGAMRNSLFAIDDANRAADATARQQAEQKAKLRFEPPIDPSPFRGRLPQAPMSMERKIRNPPSQFDFKKAPLSKQKDFMQQMRQGFEEGRGFASSSKAPAKPTPSYADPFAHDDDFSPAKTRHARNSSHGRYGDDDGSLLSPAKSRTKGSLDLRPGSWTLQSDLNISTGLEDAFGGKGFSIGDQAVVNGPNQPDTGAVSISTGLFSARMIVLVVFVGVVGAVLGVEPLRKAILLWVSGRPEGLGF